MPKAIVNKPYTNFTGGLVTEATGLSYPENTAQDLLNCDLHKSGVVSRRYGLFPELNLQATAATSFDPSWAVTVHDWPSPAHRDDLHFVVLQIGNTLYVRQFVEGGDLSDSPPDISGSGVLTFTSFGWAGATATEKRQCPLDSATGLGRLFLTGYAFEPFYLEYDPDTQVISIRYVGRTGLASESAVFIRDFTGIDDELEIDEEPTTLTEEHLYNLYNQGWARDRPGKKNTVIEKYFNDIGRYPSNSQQWILGKNADDNFSGNLLAKQDFGTSEAPKGRTLINALSGNRDELWQVGPDGDGPFAEGYIIDFSDAYDEPAEALGAFNTCAFFAGRFWLAGDKNPKRPNGVYFSQTVKSVEDAGKMYQQNDPTSEHFNELYDDDGGVLYIPEAQNILKIKPFLQGIVVWATNGVWYIRGGEAGFTAAEYAVEKIASVQCESPRSVVEVENTIMFMANSGIYAVTSPDGLTAVVNKISSPIETFYNDISAQSRDNAWGCYDRLSEKVVWFYHDSDDVDYAQSWRNAFLVYDTELGSFSPHTTDIYADGDERAGICVAIPSPYRNEVMEYDTLTTLVRNGEDAEMHLKVIEIDYDGSNGLWWVEEFSCELFADTLGSSVAYFYDSYLETGAEFLDDLGTSKRAPYVYSFFEPIEEKFFTNGGVTFAYPIAGCTVTFKWDWHVASKGGRWSNPQQAYRRRRPITAPDDIDNGAGIVYTKLKARGKGKALSIRYESQQGRAFRLAGFNVEIRA